jgi:hypothetical protein
MTINAYLARIIISLVIITGVFSYGPGPAYSQQSDGPHIQDLIINGGFEGGFQEGFGIGYGWGGFSNGNAVVGWNFDDWPAVVPAGVYAQQIEIKDAQGMDRYAGIYQVINVIPGEQYKLTIKGLIRSSEGDIKQSDYGYRLQYGLDYKGGVAWELVSPGDWRELPWDEQPMAEPAGTAYRIDTFETTITAQSDKLTLFIRGWKKWINNGSGIFDLDEISFVGPAPAGFQAPVAQAASVANADEQNADALVLASPSQQIIEPEPAPEVIEENPAVGAKPEQPTQSNPANEPAASVGVTTQGQAAPQPGTMAEPNTSPALAAAELPVSGQGQVEFNYVIIIGAAILVILVGGAVAATLRQPHSTE